MEIVKLERWVTVSCLFFPFIRSNHHVDLHLWRWDPTISNFHTRASRMYIYLFYFLPKYLNKLLFHIQTCYGCITNWAQPTLVKSCTPCTALIFCYWPAFKNMFSVIQLLCLLIQRDERSCPRARITKTSQVIISGLLPWKSPFMWRVENFFSWALLRMYFIYCC